jgi:uncharacterized protein (UPF0332 family)
MEWNDIGRSSLHAARHAQQSQPRSCVSRAYYAAHSVLTQELVGAGYVPPRNMQTPPHRDQPELIGQYLGSRGPAAVKDLRAAFRRLYKWRLDADYNRGATVDSQLALQAVRQAHEAFRIMQVTP